MSGLSITLLGPGRGAVSGVSTHLNQLYSSALGEEFRLLHFQVGSEDRTESTAKKVLRVLVSPIEFASFLIQHRPSIVHLNTSLEPKSYWRDLAYLLIACSLRRKVVFQVHGGFRPQEFFAGSRWLTGLLRWVLRRPSAVVLLAQSELEAYRHFVPNQCLQVVANAIEVGNLVTAPLREKARGPLHLLYLGRLVEDKGIFDVVDALARLRGEGRDLRLSIGGAGPQEALLKSRVAELGLSQRVQFAGALSGDAKDSLWRSGDVFVFPTYHREGLPYALLEAMAAGVVPISTRVGGIPDVIHDGLHGLLVQPHDPIRLAQAIACLDDDRVLLRRMAAAGRARVLEHYTVDRLANDFARIYRSLGAGN